MPAIVMPSTGPVLRDALRRYRLSKNCFSSAKSDVEAKENCERGEKQTLNRKKEDRVLKVRRGTERLKKN